MPHPVDVIVCFPLDIVNILTFFFLPQPVEVMADLREHVLPGNKFSKVLYIVTLHSKYTRTLTSEIFFLAVRSYTLCENGAWLPVHVAVENRHR